MARPPNREKRLYQDQRNGSYVWKPEEKLRPYWKAIVLGKAAEPAKAEARRLNRQVELWLAKGGDKKQPPRVRPGPLTVGQLIGRYMASTAWKKLRERTQDQYRYELKRLEDEFGHDLAATLPAARVMEWAEDLAFRSPESARHFAARGRALISWAVRLGHISRPDNPFEKLGLAGGRKRSFRFKWDDVRHILTVAEEEGRPSIGVALAVGFLTVARITDVLTFHHGLLRQVNGRTRLVYRQSKRQKVGKGGELVSLVEIDMPLPGVIGELLFAHPPKLCRLEGEKPGQEKRYWIVSEDTGRPYNEKTAARVFARIFAKAIARDPRKWAHLAGGQLRDGRRSGFVHRIEKGATIVQVCTISGHSLSEGHDIVEHYLPRTAELADQADAFLEVKL